MNLISHLVCAERFSDPVRLGAVLPDLLPLYRRRARPRQLVAHWDLHGGALAGAAEVVRGIRFHQQVDLHFHRSELFLSLAARLQARLREASDTPGLKRFLPAHVLAELFLDHLLLRDDPLRGADFYGLLERHGAALLEPFVAAHPLVERAGFARFLERVVADRFVEDYHTAEGILFRMDRIQRRFGQRALEPGERRAVTRTFQEQGPAVRGALADFIAAAAAWPEEVPPPAAAPAWTAAPAG
jgi:hypothetical protein